MSQHDPHEHESFIKTPTQLIVVVVLSFVVPITIIVLLAQFAFRSFDTSGTSGSPEAVAQRLKPVGEVVVEKGPIPREADARAPAAPAPVVAAAAPGAAPAAAGSEAGKGVYERACMVCHAAGVAGAPKTGDKAGWAPRLKKGTAELYASSIKGIGAMPPKGGNMSLSDADVKAAVDYMLAQSK